MWYKRCKFLKGINYTAIGLIIWNILIFGAIIAVIVFVVIKLFKEIL